MHARSIRQDYRIYPIYMILFVLFCGNCSPASTRACADWNPKNSANSPLQTFSHSKFAGFSGGGGPPTLAKTSWHSRCHNRGTHEALPWSAGSAQLRNPGMTPVLLVTSGRVPSTWSGGLS